MTTIQKEAEKVLGRLLADTRLPLPQAVRDIGNRTKFETENVVQEPFMPVPLKISESSTALWGLTATLANAITEHRYGLKQDVTINSDRATLYLFSAMVARLNDKGVTDLSLQDEYFSQYDLGGMRQMYRRLATNVYKAKDGRYFHLHGSLNATPTLTMLGVPLNNPDLDFDESVEFFSKEVAKHTSEWLDVTANERYLQAGTICYTPDEFLQTEQGKIMKNEPIYSIDVEHKHLPPVQWPAASKDSTAPLAGIRILDLSRIIAAPSISRVCAYLGAEVLRVSTDSQPDWGLLLLDGNMGKRDTRINLKTFEGKKLFEQLLQDADVVLDGLRPGSLTRLGFSRKYIHEIAKRRNKGIVHIRENCYGWKGPLQHRSGWQQISDCVTGVAYLQGQFFGRNEAVVPSVPNSDYQVGLSGAAAILNALILRATAGGSYSVDVSLNQFNLFYLSLGTHDDQQMAKLKEEHEDLDVRHYHDMSAGVQLFLGALAQTHPEVLTAEENFVDVVSEWGGDKDIVTVAKPALDFSETKLGYLVGSSKPGTHKPEWLSAKAPSNL